MSPASKKRLLKQIRIVSIVLYNYVEAERQNNSFRKGTFSSSRPVCLSLSAARLNEPLSSFINIYCTVAFPSKYYENDIASAILENGNVSVRE